MMKRNTEMYVVPDSEPFARGLAYKLKLPNQPMLWNGVYGSAQPERV